MLDNTLKDAQGACAYLSRHMSQSVMKRFLLALMASWTLFFPVAAARSAPQSRRSGGRSGGDSLEGDGAALHPLRAQPPPGRSQWPLTLLPKPSLEAYVQPIDASPTPTPATDLARVQGSGSQRQQTRPICFTWIRRPQTRHKPWRLSEPRRRITSSTRGAYRWRVSRDARLRGGRRFTATGVNCDGGRQFRVPEILSVGAGHICNELKSVSL